MKRVFSIRLIKLFLAIVLVLVLAACTPNETTKDTTPPIISLNDGNPVIVYKSSKYTDIGATTMDNIKHLIIKSSSVTSLLVVNNYEPRHSRYYKTRSITIKYNKGLSK